MSGFRSPFSHRLWITAAISRSTQRRAVGDGLHGEVMKDDMLDIPAFLRRQAD